MELDPIRLAGELCQINEARLAWEQRLKENPDDDDDPFLLKRAVLGGELFSQVQDMDQADPLREPLVRWLWTLVERRVNRGYYIEAAVARYSTEHPLQEHGKTKASLAQMLSRAMAESGRRSLWLTAFLGRADELSRISGRHWLRRTELAKRLRVPDLDALQLPLEGVQAVAQQWLAATQDLFAEFASEDFGVYLERAMAVDTRGQWPAKLTGHALESWFRDTPLFEELTPRLPSLPAPYGAASYLRALVHLGEAYRVAAASERQPFVIAHDALGLEAWVNGYLFATLPRARPFAKRRLELGEDSIRDHQRLLARVLLYESRWLALKVLLRPLAVESYDQLRQHFTELAVEHIGVPLADAGALTLPRLSEDDPQRFCGCLLAESREHSLREHHNEDWYRNPRAADQLRSEAALPPAVRVERQDIDEAFQLALTQLRGTLA